MKSLKVSFNKVDHNTKCRDCIKPIKMNLVNRKLEQPQRCYKCHVIAEASRGHRMKRDHEGVGS